MKALWQELCARAAAQGFLSAWATDVRPFDAWHAACLAAGNGMTPGMAHDPAALMPEAARIVVLAMPYAWAGAPQAGQARISPFYPTSNRAHARIEAAAEPLRAAGYRALIRPALPAKAAAERAGAGVYGRNGLITGQTYGSAVAFQLVLTDAPLPFSEAPAQEALSACEGCAACVRACPVGALDGTGRVDTARCLRAHMLPTEPIPEPLRAAMGDRLLGCDDCQTACPHNAHRAAAAQEDAPPHVALAPLLAGERDALDVLGALVGDNYARKQRVQAQAALVAGNSGDPRWLPSLRGLTQSESPAAREHAAWAIACLSQR